MSDLTIITNNVPRDVIDAWELTEAERNEFDYLDWEAIGKGEDSASFVRYKGELYDLGDIESTMGTMAATFDGWDGYVSQTFFSGILIRHFGMEGEQVIMGRYYS